MTGSSDRPVTVLVVEDEPDQLQLLTVYLTRAGCEVIAAESVEVALARIEGVELDLAVVDLLLPGTTGWALIDILGTRQPQCPLLVSSVLDVADYPAAHASLPKPFTRAQLQAALRRLVPRWSAP